MLLVAHPAEKGRRTGAVRERAEDAQRVLTVHADAGREAVEIDADALELRQQLLESPLPLEGHPRRR